MDWIRCYDKAIPALRLEEIQGVSILSAFRQNVEKRPSAPLLIYYERTLTLEEVDRLSSAFAVSLRNIAGINRGDRSVHCRFSIARFTRHGAVSGSGLRCTCKTSPNL